MIKTETQPKPEVQEVQDQEELKADKAARRSSKLILCVWLSFFCCLAIAGCILLSSEHDTSIYRGKLFHLLKQEKYYKIQKKLQLNEKVILIGDQEDGLGIFLNQFLHKMTQNVNQIKIKVRNFQPGRNLLYKTNNIFLRPFQSLKYLLFESISPKLWVIKTQAPLTVSDMEEIYQFIKDRLTDNIIIVTEAVAEKAKKTYPEFKIIQFKDLSRKDVVTYLQRERKLNQVDINNIFEEFANDLGKIDEFIHQAEDLDPSFADIYAKQQAALEKLLQVQPKKVEKLLRKMCSKGFQVAKQPLEFIYPNNGVVQYHPQEKSYRWYNKKAIFAVSDKYDIICQTKMELIPLDLDLDVDLIAKKKSSKAKGTKKKQK